MLTLNTSALRLSFFPLYMPAKKTCQTSKDAKWKQMFSYQKCSPERFQIFTSVFEVTVLTNFSCPLFSPWHVSWAPLGTHAQTGPGWSSLSSQQALKTREGLGLSVFTRLQSTRTTGLSAFLARPKKRQQHFILQLMLFFPSGETQPSKVLGDVEGLGKTSFPL